MERSHNEHGGLRRREGIDTAEVPVGHPLCEGPWVADEAVEIFPGSWSKSGAEVGYTTC